MLAKTALFCLALGLLMPAAANADIRNSHSLKGKEAKSLRQMITAKLNAMPAADTGRGNGKFFQSKLTGTYSTHVGYAGTSYSVSFQAQPRQKIMFNGKKITVSLGGCYGACSALRMPAGNYVQPQVTISGKLRAMAPGM
jgi:hypothetical protein